MTIFAHMEVLKTKATADINATAYDSTDTVGSPQWCLIIRCIIASLPGLAAADAVPSEPEDTCIQSRRPKRKVRTWISASQPLYSGEVIGELSKSCEYDPSRIFFEDADVVGARAKKLALFRQVRCRCTKRPCEQRCGCCRRGTVCFLI